MPPVYIKNTCLQPPVAKVQGKIGSPATKNTVILKLSSGRGLKGNLKMILAEKILTLRKKNGWSQEEHADKLLVSRQSISKWESSASIPDISKILDMAKLFGVTTDYLLKDDIEEEQFSQDDPADIGRKLTLAEANEYISSSAAYAKKLGFAVLLLILAPAVLILFSGLPLFGAGLSEDFCGAVGTILLLLIAAAGVSLIIISSMPMNRYDYIKRREFTPEYGVTGAVGEKFAQFMPKYTGMIALGVALCIISPVALLLCAALKAPESTLIAATGFLFIPVAIAVFIFIKVGVMKGCYDSIISDDYVELRTADEKNDRFSGIYWPAVTAVYLLWSFLTNRWSITWVVWPVAALIYAAISAAIGIKK